MTIEPAVKIGVKQLTYTLIIFSLLIWIPSSAAQNPFTSKSHPAKVSQKAVPPNPLLSKIAFWQFQLNQKMSALVRQAKETGNLKPFFLLLAIAFLYGILHAAGPGHGKAVAASYIISQKGKLGSSVLFGNTIALFHGFSGMLLVLVVHFILNTGVTGMLRDVTRTTQLISYSLITALGIMLLARNIYLWYRRVVNGRQCQKEDSQKKQMGGLAAAIVVGIIPCPGIVLVMLFCLSLDMIGLGLLLAFSMTLGMAVTISAVVVVGMAGKNLALGVLERRKRLSAIVERVIETLAAFMVTTLGALLFAATF